MAIVECKRSIRSTADLLDEIKGLADKAQCLQQQASFTRRFPPIRNGVIITEQNMGSRRMGAFLDRCESIRDNRGIRINCISGARYRILHSKALHINRTWKSGVLRIFPMNLEPTRIASSLPITTGWLFRNETTYVVTIEDGQETIAIFSMKESYNSNDWESDSSWAVQLGMGIKRLESLGGLGGMLIDDVKRLPLSIPFVDHNRKRSFFCPMWNYALLEPKEGCQDKAEYNLHPRWNSSCIPFLSANSYMTLCCQTG